jgi:hypothetical protein
VDFLPRRHAAAGQLTSKEIKESIMSNPFTQSDLRQELRSAAVEPLLPVEKKLIGWSLTTGLVLLAVLAAINHYFPAAL